MPQQTANRMRGFRAATHNPNVSDKAKRNSQEELDRLSETQHSEGERHGPNVSRGLLAATHNPNNTDAGRKQARDKLEAMGQAPEQPND